MTERYADIVVDVTQASVGKSYQYHIPAALTDKVQPGSAVLVPFGNGKRVVEGYCIGVSDKAKFDPARIKDIQDVPANKVTIEQQLIRLAVWMSRTYGASINVALKTVLPVKEKEKVSIREKVSLAISREEAQVLLGEYERKHRAAMARVLEALLAASPVEKTTLTKDLKVSTASLTSMEKAGVISITAYTSWRSPVEEEVDLDGQDLQLTEEQQEVLDGITEEWKTKDRPCLIQGITGSGKTLVYMELIDSVLKAGKQAIVLIPEISLSWQNVVRFRRRFGDRVTVMNSRMSAGERSDQYELLKRGKADIVIGPRSALFTPFPNLGLIIIDEEHETSYRSEKAPRYDARETAIERAKLEGAHVVFGSATPSVDAYYRAKEGEYALYHLHSRYGAAKLPTVQVVDMRQEMKLGNRSIISRPLQELIRDRLDNQEQVMLFLNRRGYSGFVSCRSCGKPVKCPHCDVTLTTHTNGRMICHYCGYNIREVNRCPSCGSPFISGFRAGTEKVAEEVQNLFPDARILRMDRDTTKGKKGYEDILKPFEAGQADILIGTQMIIKGHDFPKVTLVGALAADMSLYVSDYRAAERTYQMLVQAIGRAGRGKRPGQAVIQTYSPEHYSIEAAKKQDYDSFYEEEMMGREMMDYPPAANLLAIHGTGVNEAALDVAMKALRRYLARFENEQVSVIGPAPETVAKIKDNFRQVIYVKDTNLANMIRIRRLTENYIEINTGFRGMLFQYDLNA